MRQLGWGCMIWDQRYASADYVYGTDPNEFLAETIRGLDGGGRALCLAEGEGRNAVFLAGRGYEVHEGRLRTGRGAVVQIVARRP